MSTKSAQVLLLALIAAAFTAGIALYPSLPENIATHWNAAGEADGYTQKFWGVFLLPFIMVGMFFLYWVIPNIDPLKANIESFRKYYDLFWVFLFAFFLYIFALMMVWNFGVRFDFTLAIVPAVAALLFVMGIILEKSKRNWFFGIRTPWTLSSDIVWEKTHKLGGRLFKVAAFLALLGMFFEDSLAIAALALPIAVVALITVVYSYLEYRKLPK